MLLLIWLLFSQQAFPATEVMRQYDYATLLRLHQSVEVPPAARYVRARLQLQGSDLDKAPRPLRLTIKTLMQDIVLPVDGRNVFELPVNRALIDENPQVWTNIPASLRRIEIAATVRVEAAGQREFGYALLGAMRDEFSALVRGQGFLSRMSSPDVRGARIQFADTAAQTAVVAADARNVTFRSDADGTILLPLDNGWIARDVQVRLSAAPDRIELELER